MTDQIKVINKEGKQITLEQWQHDYGISGTQIGKHFSYTESKFAADLKDYGELIVNELLIRVADQFREDVGRPITVNAFNRSQAHQDELTKEGFRTASWSPHLVTKLTGVISGATAIDIDTSTHEQTNKEVQIMLAAGKKLGIKIRVGWEEYQLPSKAAPNGYTFFHTDVAPEFYAPGKPWNHLPHPKPWEQQITW